MIGCELQPKRVFRGARVMDSAAPNTGIRWMNNPAVFGPTMATPRFQNRNASTEAKMAMYSRRRRDRDEAAEAQSSRRRPAA